MMKELEGHKNLKIEHRIQAEKQREFKLIGRQLKQKGQKLYGFDTLKNTVYEVEIQKQEVIDIQKNKVSSNKAIVNPNHPMLWAINLKNAIRKFKNNGLIFKDE